MKQLIKNYKRINHVAILVIIIIAIIIINGTGGL